jgi:hypothetical protein
MDIGAAIKSSEDGAVLHLKDMAGKLAYAEDGSPVTIRLAGTDSARWRKANDKIGNDRLERARSGTKASIEELGEENALLVASVTLGWSGIVVDGKPWDFTVDNAKKLYLTAAFVYEQVNDFVGKRANFSPASSTNSSQPPRPNLDSISPVKAA